MMAPKKGDTVRTAVKQRGLLWAGSFRREVLSKPDESPFGVWYADEPSEPSRPNIPVKVLVGPETLKTRQGLSHEEIHVELSYELQVPFARLREFG